ncbi:MAG: hypothetical protein M3514_05420 [Actinomycetota bacterium]|jgi:hypothetical protein|nr:hypothetical protein [Rubrobacteraceae bacterium]MDQ3496937.1 hypothetical protein [Actinomycetota bacterium]
MEKTVPAKLSAQLPEQLALPLEQAVPPSPEKKDAHPREMWTTMGPQSRTLVKERWIRVMREVASDARD